MTLVEAARNGAALWSRLVAQADELLHRLQEYVTSVRAAIAILIAAITLVVWAVRQEARITSAVSGLQAAQDRLTDIDVHGTRSMAEKLGALTERVTVVEKRVTVANQILQEQDVALSRRIEALEPSSRTTEVVSSRQQDVLRRLDVLEKNTGEVDVLANEITRLREQQSRIIQALDNTYNTLQEALRGGAITRKPTPSDEQPPR